MNRHRIASVPAERLQALLRDISAATRSGELSRAVKLADVARRISPHQPSVAALQARLLARLNKPQAALDLLPRHPSDAPLSVQALRIELLLALKRHVDATDLSRELLAAHALDAVDGLPHALDQLCLALNLPGWLAVDSSLRLVGHVRSGAALEWRQGPSVGHVPADGSEDAEWVVLSLPRPQTNGELLHVVDRHGTSVFGGPLSWPPQFGAAGWVLREGQSLHGEVQLTWAPRRPRMLVVRSAGALLQRLPLAPQADAGALLGFQLPIPSVHSQSILDVSLECPDGTEVTLLGSPVAAATPVSDADASSQLTRVRSPALAQRPAKNKIDIVIPVYRGRHETLRCLNTVFATVPAELAEIVVINDASPDEALATDLRALKKSGRITLLVNHQNLGFPGTANRGLSLHRDRDVVVLNADCAVFGNWLQRLVDAADTAPDIGTVTPLGDVASILSYPSKYSSAGDAASNDDLPDPEAIDAMAADANAGQVVAIPVGVGFCMYIRRGCLRDVGLFDAEAFARGYGEENDFCLRAVEQGWRHVAATNVYVQHRGSRSFGAERDLWMARNHRVLTARHPDYDQLIKRFITQDPLLPARRAIDLARLRARASQARGERVLLISLALPGGVMRHVDARMAVLRNTGAVGVLMRPDFDQSGRMWLSSAPLELRDLCYPWPNESASLIGALRSLDFARIEIHHFLDVPPDLMEAVLQLGLPYSVTLHDHAWVCPRLTLVGGDQRYCGEPALSACESCVSTHGSELEPGLTVSELRQRSTRWLRGAQRVVGPSADLQSRYQRYFLELRVDVQPWELSFAPPAYVSPTGVDWLRVAVIGAISAQKGFHVLLDCAREAARRALPIEFVLIGFSEDDAQLLDSGRVFITGPYQDSEIDGLLKREKCHVAWFPSVAPETWCYALSHAMRQGMPIVGFAVGAVGERLEDYGQSQCLPLSASNVEILRTLMTVGGSATQLPPISELFPPDMADAAALPGVSQGDVSGTSQAEPDDQPVATDVAPSSQTLRAAPQYAASVQPLVLPEGVYAFRVPGERAAGSVDETPAMRFPAMGIGPAPVPHSSQVDLFSSPKTLDRWLSAPGDQITVRIQGGDVTLLLNSVRRPEDVPLTIDVRRLDKPVGDSDSAPTLRVLLHVQYLGDLHFGEGQAGPLAPGLSVEALVVECHDENGMDLVEYRGQTADGFETPWLGEGMLCGSRGRGVPLMGFAVRPRVVAADGVEFRYRGYFRDAGWVTPQQSGEWCRSTRLNDPLEGIEVHRVSRE